MAFIEWKSEHNVAVKSFNDDHKKLFGYINDLHSGMTSGLGISEMGYILKHLVDYTVEHFTREEKLFIKHNYPDYESHKEQHDFLVNKVGTFYEEYMEGKTSFSIELLTFLNDWIKEHILKTDMQYKEFFKEIARKQ